jgi:hypothetical protein
VNAVPVAVTRRTRTWTPKAIPFGMLILLLGAWAALAPLVGPYFNFGFAADKTWQFTTRQWELQIIPGIVAAVGGFMLMTPARGWGRLGALLAFLSGFWLVCGWAFYPVWASGQISPYGSDFWRGLRWLGQLLGPGGLILFLTGATQGLFMRRTIRESVPAAPVAETTVTTPE